MTARRFRISRYATRRRPCFCRISAARLAAAKWATALRPRAVFWNHVTASICDATALSSAPSTPLRRKSSVLPNW